MRDQVALVSQNVHLFNDTVANNIAYARTDIYSREQIEEAARMAYAMDFINKMDDGLDTVIGENGVLLSGGQRQRIAIARALLRDSPILIWMKRRRLWIPNPNALSRLLLMNCRKTAPRWSLRTVFRPSNRRTRLSLWKMG